MQTTVAALEKKPLLVYLACSLHENYDHYNKWLICFVMSSRLLAAPHVVETFQENYICWGCDVSSRYGYSLALLSFPLSSLVNGAQCSRGRASRSPHHVQEERKRPPHLFRHCLLPGFPFLS